MGTPETDFGLLICTNGSEASLGALTYGVWLADLLSLPVHLLGIIENPHRQGQVEKAIRPTVAELEGLGISPKIQYVRGRGSVAIARVTQSGSYLTVVGRLGRPYWRRLMQGRSFRRLLARVETPILYVPKPRLPVRRILVCLGGLGYAQGVVRLSAMLAKAAGAEVTLLHVVEPITLDYPTAHEIGEHTDEILTTQTPQAKHLNWALEELEKHAVPASLKVRQGNVVHEIHAEVADHPYDLVGMGSPHSVRTLRHLYLPNVTAEVAEGLQLPVLSVRQGGSLLT